MLARKIQQPDWRNSRQRKNCRVISVMRQRGRFRRKALNMPFPFRLLTPDAINYPTLSRASQIAMREHIAVIIGFNPYGFGGLAYRFADLFGGAIGIPHVNCSLKLLFGPNGLPVE